MNVSLVIGLCVACVVLMIIERLGVPTTLELSFRGDIKRESQWLAQYGQAVCTAAAAALVWQLDPSDQHRRQVMVATIVVGVSCASVSAFVIKRLLGRARPKRENAGKFLGFTMKHDNARESFPSSHSACAVALTVCLTRFYPEAAITFWTLAFVTAGLRYIMDAHWPSDVIGGIALGYVCGYSIILAFHA
jgi:membrane-associated phospholipid phosphatase